MPNGTPQDADNLFFTKISGSFQPNGASPAQPSVTLMVGPPNVTIAKGVTVGGYTLTLPANYTPSVVQSYYMSFSHIKNAANDPVIVGAMQGGFVLPSIVFMLTNSLGTGVDFTANGNERVVWELYIKYFTVLTF